MALKRLFSPVRVGSVVLRNRIMCSPCELSDSAGGFPSRRMLSHYVEIAKGECGLIIPGTCYVSSDGATHATQAGLHTAGHVRAWKSTIGDVHALGAKMVFQLQHGGPWALNRVNVAALGKDDISRVVAQHAMASARLEAVGAAGVQLHAAHGYFLSSLLSLKPELGMEILTRCVEECRRAAGPEFLVGVKINGEEGVPGLAGGHAFVGRALQAAAPDFAEISVGGGLGGSIRSHWNARRLRDELPAGARAVLEAVKDCPPPKEGYTLEAARAIKAMNPQMVVASVGGWKTVTAMSAALRDVDLVSLGRPFIREPQLVKHLREGAGEVECVRCGRCIVLFWEVSPIRCFMKESA